MMTHVKHSTVDLPVCGESVYVSYAAPTTCFECMLYRLPGPLDGVEYTHVMDSILEPGQCYIVRRAGHDQAHLKAIIPIRIVQLRHHTSGAYSLIDDLGREWPMV